ncbi:hypothetical protein RM844_07345 [Streptomyces sp. DSM 44915]|uniref:Uncharacterized protein n=1 Tax=Streptomyces chisholmiae TaxID=3075540 RepID=A0ABU2JN28_9ACTN|nr:hypothetical protein [Streptomyces sp. DSM 44915]MDT0266109.1 hypothetical protein [Streptomyces sp. DSM 44915]
MDEPQPAALNLWCPTCSTHHAECDGHRRAAPVVPASLAWVDLDRLTPAQWAGTACVRCGGAFAPRGMTHRWLGEVITATGLRRVLYDHAHHTPQHGC